MTKHELIQRLFLNDSKPTAWKDSSGFDHVGILQSVQREDCSGRSFNITITIYEPSPSLNRGVGQTATFHMRTTD